MDKLQKDMFVCPAPRRDRIHAEPPRRSWLLLGVSPRTPLSFVERGHHTQYRAPARKGPRSTAGRIHVSVGDPSDIVTLLLAEPEEFEQHSAMRMLYSGI
jgi:hypothetical protein